MEVKQKRRKRKRKKKKKFNEQRDSNVYSQVSEAPEQFTEKHAECVLCNVFCVQKSACERKLVCNGKD